MDIHRVLIALVAVFAVQSNAFVGRHDPQLLSLLGEKAGKLSLLFAAEVSGTNEWTTLRPRVSIWGYGGDHPPVVFNVNDEMYAITGNGKGTTVVFNCTMREMYRSRPFGGINPKVCVATAVDDRNFIVVGGWNAFHFMDPLRLGDKIPLPNLMKTRWKPGIVCLDKKVYVMGGYNPHKERYEDTIEMLDLSLPSKRREWTLLPSRMREGREGCSAVVDFNGNIVVTGGFSDGRYLDSVEVFDTRNQEWRRLPRMLSRRAHHSVVSLDNGRTIVAIGGCDCGCPRSSERLSAIKTAELLRLDNGGKALYWIPIPSMNTARAYLGALALTSGTQPGIFVYGGGPGEWASHKHLATTLEFLPNPSPRDIIYWTPLHPPTIKHKRFPTT